MAIVEGGRTTHTTLECKSVAASLRFYRDVMGLRVNQIAPGVGHVIDSKGQYAAVLQNANPGPQPFLNFYARPVAGAAAVDAAHAAYQHGSYSFYLQDPDTNWWELEIWHDAISPVDRG